MDIADRLFGELNSPENIEARRHVFQNLKEKPAEEEIEKLMVENQDAMKKVLNSLDRVAFLTQKNWIPDSLIMPWMHPMIAKSWEKLEAYVLYERERRDEPYYYVHAERLAKRCERWRKENLTEAERSSSECFFGAYRNHKIAIFSETVGFDTPTSIGYSTNDTLFCKLSCR